MGPFTLQVLAERQWVPPDADTPRDRCNAQQTSTARLDPEQPQKVGRAGHQGHHYHRPGSRGRPLPAVGRVTTEKSPGMSQAAWNPALHHRGDVWWWLPAPTPSGDDSQLRLSARNWPRAQAALRKGVLQAEGLSPGLSVQASLPCVTRPKCTADSWGCFLLLRVRDKRIRRRLQAPGQVFAFHRQAGMPEDCPSTATVLLNGCMGALPGHRHTEAITRVPAL